MRALIKLLILFGIAGFAAFYLKDNHDVIMLMTANERVTMPLVTAILLILFGFGFCYVLVRLLVRLFNLPKAFSHWSEKRHEEKDVELLEKGWIELFEGRSDKAEKDLLRLIDHTHHFKRQVLASMAAARAAHDLSHFDKRDELLAKARQLTHKNPRFEATVATVQAELLLNQGQGQLALEPLEFAYKVDQKNTYVQQLLCRAYRQAGMTLKMIDIAVQLHRKQLMSTDELAALIEQYGTIYIANASHEEAVKFYDGLHSKQALLPSLVLAMVARYEQVEQWDKVGKLLEKALQHQANPRLLEKYVHSTSPSLNERIQKVQHALSKDENNVDLLLALSQLCLMEKLWGQAERYLNKVLQHQKHPRAYMLLGMLNDAQGHMKEALHYWRLASLEELSELAEKSDVLPAADMSNDPQTPPDVKNLEKPDDHFLSTRLETGRGIIANQSDEEFFDSAPPLGVDHK